MSKHAVDFEKIINAGRERKKNEALAARIFSTDNQRRASAPLHPNAGGSLASRVGIKKRVSTGGRIAAGNVNGDWTHDLHEPKGPANTRTANPNSLAARIHPPGTTLVKPQSPATSNFNTRANGRTTRLANAFNRTATSSPANASQQMNVRPSAAPRPGGGPGITIRGLAGPFVIMAQNFAPGTTAADIESAMTPVGGLVTSCRLVKTSPIVIAEIVFESKEGADAVIQTFHNQTADGRTLNVYLKPGGAFSPAPPTGPRAQRGNETRTSNGILVDGSMGFEDPMETDAQTDDVGNNYNTSGAGLYSDSLVSSKTANGNSNSHRRGRGFQSDRQHLARQSYKGSSASLLKVDDSASGGGQNSYDDNGGGNGDGYGDDYYSSTINNTVVDGGEYFPDNQVDGDYHYDDN